jgi:RNA polymerase sigma-70 factor (ECF subfamily)
VDCVRQISNDSPNDREAALIRRILDGESALYPELLRDHELVLRRQVSRIVKNPADADDVMQETRWKALRNLARFRGESSFRSWLVAIGLNEARMIYRYQERSRCVSFEEAKSQDAPSVPTRSKRTVLDQLCSEQDSRALDTVIRMLPPRLKAVIEVRFRLDASLQQTAKLAGSPGWGGEKPSAPRHPDDERIPEGQGVPTREKRSMRLQRANCSGRCGTTTWERFASILRPRLAGRRPRHNPLWIRKQTIHVDSWRYGNAV